ncbi:MAG: DUF1318 domain-containing protein [Rhodospirillales bacterium]|nr:DUF1318 domain-containing protein [Rhodospirillales bacterium]
MDDDDTGQEDTGQDLLQVSAAQDVGSGGGPVVAAVAVAACCFGPPVHAQSVDQAKAAGQVVERSDGMLAACPGTPAAISALVERINAARLKHYRGIADKTPDATVTQVQALAGVKLQRTAPGGCK